MMLHCMSPAVARLRHADPISELRLSEVKRDVRKNVLKPTSGTDLDGIFGPV
jgi:hypothetical protein